MVKAVGELKLMAPGTNVYKKDGIRKMKGAGDMSLKRCTYIGKAEALGRGIARAEKVIAWKKRPKNK
jgi:hypothetical protein